MSIRSLSCSVTMLCLLLATVTTTALAAAPASKFAEVNGVRLHYLVAGAGEPVVLLHGYAQSSRMWLPLINKLSASNMVIAPDLPGAGQSSVTADNYTKRVMAQDIHALVKSLGKDSVRIAGHDIGLMVAYAYAAQYPGETQRVALLDAFLPGIGKWQDVWLLRDKWHFNFYGETPLALVQGRERTYLEHFWNDFAADRQHSVPEQDRQFYAKEYAQPGHMKAGFEWFHAFEQDAADFAELGKTPLTMPMLVVGGEKASGSFLIEQARLVDRQVTGVIVPGSGHWLMEEATDQVVPLLTEFLGKAAPPGRADTSPQSSTPGELVDALNLVFGPQQKNRAVHAKGLVVEGSFMPSAPASTLSKAPHFQKSRVTVTARFSDFAGLPAVPDTHALATPRGLALKFHLPDGTDTDLVTHSFNGFPAATADEFRRFLIALGTSGPNVPAPTPADKYLAAHPIAKTFLESQPGPPVGYGTLAYFGVNAFEFTNAAGEVRYARYRIEPLDGEHFLTKAQVAAASPTYLDEQLRKQLPSQPLRFKFIAQVAAPGDKLDDPSVAWPESRQRIELGTLELTRVVTNSDAAQEQLLFMPLALPDGIRAADPMLKARNDAYPISYSRRHR